MVMTSPYSKIIFFVVSGRLCERHIESLHHFFIILPALFCLLPFAFFFVAVTLGGSAGRSLCAWLPSQCFSDYVLHVLTPSWFDCLGGRVPCLPTRQTMWYVFWLPIFILLFGCILPYCQGVECSASVSCHLEFRVLADRGCYCYYFESTGVLSLLLLLSLLLIFILNWHKVKYCKIV